jgi:hypothetical protein
MINGVVLLMVFSLAVRSGTIQGPLRSVFESCP